MFKIAQMPLITSPNTAQKHYLGSRLIPRDIFCKGSNLKIASIFTLQCMLTKEIHSSITFTASIYMLSCFPGPFLESWKPLFGSLLFRKKVFSMLFCILYTLPSQPYMSEETSLFDFLNSHWVSLLAREDMDTTRQLTVKAASFLLSYVGQIISNKSFLLKLAVSEPFQYEDTTL